MTGIFWERRLKNGFAALLSLLSRLASIVTLPASLHSALSCSSAAACAALRADEGEVGADCCLQPSGINQMQSAHSLCKDCCRQSAGSDLHTMLQLGWLPTRAQDTGTGTAVYSAAARAVNCCWDGAAVQQQPSSTTLIWRSGCTMALPARKSIHVDVSSSPFVRREWGLCIRVRPWLLTQLLQRAAALPA